MRTMLLASLIAVGCVLSACDKGAKGTGGSADAMAPASAASR